MCYNSSISFSFGFIGIITSIYIILYEPKLRSMYIPVILLFYTSMEILQGFQYNYINQCNNKINILLTELAYILVILQPLMWNIFFYINTTKCEQQIFMVGIVFALVWMVINISARISYTSQNSQLKRDSVFSSSSSCTKKNRTHLFWTWPSAHFGDLTANYLLYLLIFFIPALVSSSFRMVSIILAIFAIIGAFMAYIADEYYIFTSVWCYISVPMIIMMTIYMYNNL